MPITSKFICLNGRFLKEEELVFDASNRAFRYGDGFFETMHYANGEIQLFDLHLKRIKKAMHLLKLESYTLCHSNFLHKEIVHLNNANHFFKGARVRISIFRDGKGLYLPESNNANYLIESWPLENSFYPINNKGLKIDIYSQTNKATGSFHFYKSLNTQVSILAALHKKEINIDDCFLTNSDNDIIESISSNVFFIQNKTLFTPSLNSGCIHGVMREHLLTVVKQLNLSINEQTNIKEKDISFFDEIFLSNAIQGIQWIGAFHTKRYDNKIVKQIHKLLVKSIFQHL